MAPTDQVRARTGIEGLDSILDDGLPTNHLYLLDGEPGAGKTTLALQFLLEGVGKGEGGLYVTLSESKQELTAVAASHGWKLDGIDIFELGADELGRDDAGEYTIFHPAEVELQQTMRAVFDIVERVAPVRVVFDSLSEMRLLARDPLRFRRQILSLKQFFSGRECTVLLLDDKSAPEGDMQLHSLAHGVILLEHMAMEYGAERRRLQVTKLRGARFRGGYHDFRIKTGGIAVYPRIRKSTPGAYIDAPPLLSGNDGLEALLGGGLARGTSTYELLTYLSNKGVTSIITLVQSGIFGGPIEEVAEVSYLADTVVLLRYFEFQGSVRGAISVVKKRSGPHERTIRECRVERGGLVVGEPLHEFQGVLTGVPAWHGERAPLMAVDPIA